MRYQLVELKKLRGHEKISMVRLRKMMRLVARLGEVKPIVATKDSLVILDGHHRVAALKRLGYRFVPAVLVDYEQDVRVRLRRGNLFMACLKRAVVAAARRRELFPPKTTCHEIRGRRRVERVSLAALSHV